MTLPAPGKGTLKLDGSAIAAANLPQTVTKADIDAGRLTYTPPANANGSGYASFTFKVNDGTDDSASAYTLTLDVTALNDPATGVPTITGTAHGRADADGGHQRHHGRRRAEQCPTYAYQWIRVATDSTETDISGATSSTYTLVAEDEGKTIKVKVSFSDDAGNPETLTSAATARVAAAGAANAVPTASHSTVTTNEDTDYTFAAANFNFADTDSGAALSSVKIVTLPAPGKGTLKLSGTNVTANATVTKAQLDAGNLKYTPPANANGSGYASFTFKVNDGTDDSASAYTLTLDVTAVNDPATGTPTITGTAQVGQTLTAVTSAIMDADGLSNVSYAYQWIRVATDSTETDISGATASGYTLVADDQGKTIKVKVSFSDDANNAETLTSVATAAVAAAPNAAPTASHSTVTTNEDTDYTFAAANFNFADTDSGAALSSVKIVTLPASGKGTLELDGSAIASGDLPQTVTKADIDAGKLTYTPPPNANGSGYASFTFKVNDGADDSASAYTLTLDVTALNDPATGTPTITGTAQVGQTLTAVTSAIMDADGLSNVSYAYQWIRVDGGSETDISGATSSGYTLVADDQGKTIKVKVSFRDDANNAETLTSVATAAVAAAPNTAPTASHSTVITNEDTDYTFAAANFNFTDTDSGAALSSVKIVTLPAPGKGTLKLDGSAIAAANLPQTVTKADIDAGNLKYSPPANANGSAYASFTFKVNDGTDDSASAYTLTLDVTALNDPATGTPTITGTAQVGQTLTAVTSAIMDADGLSNVSYAYQWIRVDGGSETDISGATSSTYTLVADDEGKTIKVKVSFSDDANNAETLTSVATAAVAAAPNAAPTASDRTVTTNEDTDYTFAAANFNFADTDSGAALSSVKIVTLPASGKGTLELDGSAIASGDLPQTVTRADIDAGKLIYTPPANANGSAYASFTFKVNDGADDSASAYTLTLDVTALNDPATGTPTITGTAQVGQTLTAVTSAIMDADGLSNVSYAYQWIRVATDSTETDISGATASGYTLVRADQGATIKVKVSFSDDANNAETLTSVATAAVAAAPNTAATGVPGITGTAQVGQTLTAVTSAIMDADGLSNVSYAYQWIRVATDSTETDISGATASGYTLVRADQGATIKVKVSFSDDANNAETLTSVATAAVAAAPNTAATGVPGITGTAQVGQTLTAVTSAIMDADGLSNVSYTYQWIRVATDSTETDISGATASGYTLVRADQGATIKVKVSFRDDANNAETLTSVATAAVAAAPNTAATGVPGITGTAQVGQTLTAVTSAIMDADGLSNVSYAYQWIRVATDSTETDISGATASGYTLVRADQGATIKVKVSFRDDANNAETLTSVATAAVAAAPNTAATGVPGITGTAQVGQTLTAVTSAIMDADGLSNVSYTYQWIRVATDSTETDISGATASGYTLVRADQGATIKVKVSFSDDANNAETLTSVATAAVAAAPNTAATGVPGITGTAQVGQTLTAVTSAIMDADGLSNVSYAYQWIRVATDSTETDISGATASGYTLVRADHEAQDDQGQGELQRRRRQPRDAHQRGDGGRGPRVLPTPPPPRRTAR